MRRDQFNLLVTILHTKMNTESPQIQRLRERFKSSMPEKANLLTQHLHVLLDHEEPIPEAYEAIKEDVHKLAGSLGMYGYSDLAKTARKVMEIIDDQDNDGLQHELLNLRNLLVHYSKS